MAIIRTASTKTVVTDDPPQPMLGPEETIEQLRAMQERIPEYVQLPKNRPSTLRRRATVNIELTREAIGAAGVSEAVQHAVGNTPEELHAAEDELGRWTAAEAEMRATLRGLAAANQLRRERLGLASLQILNVCRELVRNEDHAALLPHVEAMSRMAKYSRRRKPAKAKAEDAAKATQPAPQQPAKAA